MKKKLYLFVLLLGYPAFFSGEAAAAEDEPDLSGEAVAEAVITVASNPEYARTDASGAFTAEVSLTGNVTDKDKLPLEGITVSIPYYGHELTAATDFNGEFTTNTVSFAGTVVNDADEPIADAWVSMQTKAKPLLTDTSDENGAFVGGGLLVGIRAPYSFRQLNREGAVLRGNRLTIAMSATQTIGISLFTVTGRRLFSVSIDNLSDRARSIDLPELPAGFYLLKVFTGTRAITFKQIFLSNQALLIQKSPVSPNQIAATAKKAVSATADTLVAFADGYLTGFLAVSTDAMSELKVTLEASKQWKPAGADELEHEGRMVKIKAEGCNFSMGQPVMLTEEIDQIRWEVEVPSHTVSFTYDFWMDTTEVTQKQYADVMKACYSNYEKSGWTATYGLGDDIASTHMTYGDAILYCNALSKAEDLDTIYSYTEMVGDPGELVELKGLSSDYLLNGYRLPTEAEWEYACRGGTVTDFYWNKNYRPYPATEADTAEISANCIWGIVNATSAESPDYAVKSGVAKKQPNAYGLYDMAGSLTEWTHAGEGLYTGEAQIDPKPSTDLGDELFLVRGGHWGNKARDLRSANRLFAQVNYPYFFYGFRVVREVW
ncbi:MAG: SUMF1/EgtB/PvdO family nonheme iron enzyme [Chitinispirillaceae bacterium]|nr:SUMF1/EgtB/PvdO family nonheme iron enzyme [Chitinispirillaceae bacterium]